MNLAPGLKILFVAAMLVIVVAGMREATPILVPFLLALFIAVVCIPPLSWLRNKGLPASLALTVVVAVGVAAISLVTAVIASSLTSFRNDLPKYQERLTETVNHVVSKLKDVAAGGAAGEADETAWLKPIVDWLSSQALLDSFNPGAAMSLVANLLGGLGEVLSNAFLIGLTAIFILLEVSDFPAKLRAALPNAEKPLAQFDAVVESIKNYIAIKTVVSLATGVAVTLWLMLIGVDYPLLWGLLAFLLNFIPNIGSILAAVPAVLLALVQLGGWPALLVAVGYVAINLVVGYVIEPRYLGRGLGLSTLVVFLSLVFWGWVLGPVGMLLSVPLTMAFKIALQDSEETRWIAILLGSHAPEEPAPRPAKSEPPSGEGESAD